MSDGSIDAPPTLGRVMNPKSVAIVGVSENSPWAHSAQRSLDSDAEFFFVHHKAQTVFGHEAYPQLSAIGKPVDAVFCALGAERIPH